MSNKNAFYFWHCARTRAFFNDLHPEENFKLYLKQHAGEKYLILLLQ